jgi:hypothetical protein
VVEIRGGALRFGAWNFSGVWRLGFEASQSSRSIENSEELKIVERWLEVLADNFGSKLAA